MNLIVEDGTGVLRANSYAGLTYAYVYLAQRGRIDEWEAAGVEKQKQSLIAATDYIDNRFGLRFPGKQLINNIKVPASGMALLVGGIEEDTTLLLGDRTYTFKEVPADISDIAIKPNTEEQMQAIITRLSGNMQISASRVGMILVIESAFPGLIDKFPTVCSSESLVFENDHLVGGTISGTQSLQFPRNAFIGIPETLKKATVEYASRAITDKLLPDPIAMDESGREVAQRTETVGPITESFTYSRSVPGAFFKEYPEADLLIKSLLPTTGGVYR